MNTELQSEKASVTPDKARTYPDMSPRTLIETNDDKQWLRETHGITGDFAVAMIFGNEDCPSRVETFTENHYKCPPLVWIRDINYKLVEQKA